METLRAGSRGEDVELCQAALNYHIGKGKKIQVDGRFGNETQTRVIAFQNFHGLVPDGVIGHNTQAKLFQAITFLGSAAIMKRPSADVRQSVAPSPGFSGLPVGPFPKPFDFSDLKMWPDVKLWPEPPVPANPWPQLILTLPPFPQMPGLPPPPPPPRLVVNTSIVPGSTIFLPPPAITPFDTPSADIFLFKFSVLSREKNLKVDGKVEPMLDDDGHTYKFQGTARAEIDVISSADLKASVYTKIEAEAGVPPPTGGKVTGSSGLKFKFFKGKLELATEFKWLTIDSDKNQITAGPSALKGTLTVFF